MAVFEVDKTVVPVLIEVVDLSAGGAPSLEPSYVDALQHYAALTKTPLLIALKHLTFWTLFEARHLRQAGDNLTISLSEAMGETLLCLLAGDFSFSFRPGVGMHVKIRKDREVDGGFED